MNIEDVLREAAPGANDLFLSELPDPKDCHYTVSKRFERKMNKLLKRQNSPVLYWVQRSVACFLLVVLLGGTTVLTFSAEARAAFFGWVREVYEEYFVYRYVGEDQPISEDNIYRPTWVPEGYSEIAGPDPGIQVSIIYQGIDGDTLLFAYSTDSSYTGLFIPQENVVVQSVSTSVGQAEVYLDNREDEPNVITWIDTNTDCIFYITGHLDKDELVKMAESVTSDILK